MSKLIIKDTEKEESNIERHGLYIGQTKFGEDRLIIFKKGEMLCQLEILSNGKLNIQINTRISLYKNIRPVKNADIIVEI
ncbi:MAG: hypothetical protein ACOC80_16535 [Petrotogales bacterium]